MKIRLIAIIVPLIALILALTGGFGLLWRFFVFVAAMLILSYLWIRLSIRHIDGTFGETSAYCRVGESFEEEFTISNNSRILTSLIEVQEETDLPGYKNMVSFSLPAHSSQSWRTRVICNRRGRYNLGVLNVKVTDPLGLFSMQRQFGRNQRIIVYPEMLELPFFQAVPRVEPGTNPRRWLVSEISPNAARVREYTSGDSLRHIHWHSTAHTGALMVKEFDPDRSRFSCKDVWIIPDMHKSANTGDGDETIEEYSITTAASLAKKYIDNDKQVGMVVSGDRSYLYLPKTGKQQLQKILHTLAEVRASGSVGIDNLLTAEIGRFETGSVVVVITSSDNRGIIAPLRRAISQGAIVMVILLDSLSFGGKTSAAVMARSLISIGITVYIVKRGMDIVRALDSRIHATQM